MNKRTLTLAAGALLLTGETAVYASSTPEEGKQNEREVNEKRRRSQKSNPFIWRFH